MNARKNWSNASRISVRISAESREALAEAAAASGKGPYALAREILEAQLLGDRRQQNQSAA